MTLTIPSLEFPWRVDLAWPSYADPSTNLGGPHVCANGLPSTNYEHSNIQAPHPMPPSSHGWVRYLLPPAPERWTSLGTCSRQAGVHSGHMLSTSACTRTLQGRSQPSPPS